MKKNRYPILSSVLTAALLAAPVHRALAEDIDLFVASSTTTSTNPNILIVLDNSANWNSNSQGWPTGKQGQSELAALYSLVGEVTDKVNVGVMMLTAGTGGNKDGAFVRFHVSQMTTTNKTALQNLIGTSGCVDGTEPVTNTPKCILKNFNTNTEQNGSSGSNYSHAMFEVFKYFGGYSTPAHATAGDDLGGTPIDTTAGPTATHFGAVRFSGNPDPKIDQRAMDTTKTTYNAVGSACSKNYVILIGNGFTSADDTDGTVLAGVGGATAQLSMPTYTTISANSTVTLGTDRACYASSAACVSAAGSVFPNYQGFELKSTGYSCSTQTGSNATTTCTTSSGASGSKNYLVKGVLNQVANVPTGGSAVPASSKKLEADEWAQFLYKTDVSAAAGVQNVQVFTIDVFRDQPNTDQSALLASMAKFGGGKYFQATNESAILDALRRVMVEIQSVNEVFASASLPINATNRSQNENQVFIGLFRPDTAAKPRWYGNLKRYQIGLFGDEAKLADKNGVDAVDATTSGFINLCATSFWTTDSTTYWTTPSTPGNCTTSGFNKFSDSPDGPMVEKGGVSEVLRMGNNPPQDSTTATYAVNRTIYTCKDYASCVFGSAPDAFDDTTVNETAVGAIDTAELIEIINYTRGQDVDAENFVAVSGDATRKLDARVTIHGDVTHSRPLPVNYGGSTGVVMFYGANDGMFRAVRGNDGQELWAFVAPEHHSKLRRLRKNEPLVAYPSVSTTISPTPLKKDYFFDGSAGVFQNADNSKIFVYPTMRRGGRVLYALDVTSPSAPRLKWRVGCPNVTDDTDCTTGFAQIGQTWSFPNVALIKGFSTTTPAIVMGGGYDACEDQDVAAPVCTSTKGNRVFVMNGDTGSLIRAFTTDRAVVGDVTLIDRDFDGLVDHAYAADTGGALYRIDFVDPSTLAQRASTDWTITKIAATTGAGRKFLFGPAALPTAGKVYLSLASGDRERPLVTNYPYVGTVVNRAYMFIDTFATTGLPVNLDGSTMNDFTSGSSCSTQLAVDKGDGWFFSLTNGRGEQAVNQSTIFGGLIFFSTNRPDTAVSTTSCKTNLGIAYGYAVNLLNGSGAVGTTGLCGGTSRSGVFTGGGLPPSPVTGTVPVAGKDVTVMIGGIQRTGAASSPIGSQKVKPTIAQKRTRMYWYKKGDQ
jgi:type IV pilus assembly protein PilY1